MVASVLKILDTEAISLLEKLNELCKEDNSYTKVYTDSLKEIQAKQEELQGVIVAAETKLREESDKLAKMQKAAEALKSFAANLDDSKATGFELLSTETAKPFNFGELVSVTASTIDQKMSLKVETQFELNQRKEDIEKLGAEVARLNSSLNKFREKSSVVNALYERAVNHQIDSRGEVIACLQTLLNENNEPIFNENELIAFATLLTIPEFILDDYVTDRAKAKRQYMARLERITGEKPKEPEKATDKGKKAPKEAKVKQDTKTVNDKKEDQKESEAVDIVMPDVNEKGPDLFGLGEFNQYGTVVAEPEVPEAEDAKAPEEPAQNIGADSDIPDGIVIPDIPTSEEDQDLTEEEAIELEADPVVEDETVEETIEANPELEQIREELLKYKSASVIDDVVNNNIRTKYRDLLGFIEALKARNINIGIIPTTTLLAPIARNIAFIKLIDSKKGNVDEISAVIKRGSYSNEVTKVLAPDMGVTR